MATYGRETTADDRTAAAYSAEHGVAWLLALAAVIMGVLGLLTAFGIIGEGEGTSSFAAFNTGAEGGAFEAVGEAIGADDATVTSSNWAEGALLLLPAIALGLVARALHGNEHHTRRANTTHDDANDGLFRGEHAAAYVAAGATVAASALALLVGFDVFERGNTAGDGLIWGLAAVLLGVVTGTLHEVRHHQLAYDEDVLARMVDERLGERERPARRRPAPIREIR